METGPAQEEQVVVPEEGAEEATLEKRTLSIGVDENGKMDLDFDGEFKTHEAFGLLAVSFLHHAVQQFVNPGLVSVMQAQKISEQNVLIAIKSALEAVGTANAASDEGNALLDSLKGVIENFQAPK